MNWLVGIFWTMRLPRIQVSLAHVVASVFGRLGTLRSAYALPLGLVALVIMASAAPAQVYRDWRTECLPDGTQCVLASAVVDPRNTWLAAMVVDPAEDGQSGVMQILVPPGVHLASGLFLAIGRAAPRSAEFQTCSAEGCLALLDLDAAEITALRRASRARITYRPRPSTQPIRFNASLMGFTAALAQSLKDTR